MKQTVLVLSLISAVLLVRSEAATLDFLAEFPGDTYLGTPNFSLVNAQITASGGDVFIFDADTGNNPPGPLGGFCGVTEMQGADCSTDIEIRFAQRIGNLTFTTNQFDDGDVLRAQIFDGAQLLSEQVIAANQLVDFSAFSGIDRLVLIGSETTGDGLGLAYGRFQFAVVPIPAAGPLLLLPLALISVVGRLRRLN